MPINARVTYHFKSPDSVWKEYWYVQATNLNGAINQAFAWYPSRLALCGVLSYITGITATDLTPGVVNSTQYSYQAPPKPAAGGTPADTYTDTAWDAILCRVAATDGTSFYHRSLWLRGVQDQWIEYDINNAPIFTPAFLQLVVNLQQAMNNQAMNTAYLNVLLKGGGRNAPSPVTGVSIGAAPGLLVVLDAITANIGVGASVRVAGCKGSNLKQLPPGYKGVNGVWTVAGVTGTTVTIGLPSIYLPGVPKLKVYGTIRPRQMGLARVTSIQPLFFRSHATAGFRGGKRGAKRRRGPSIP